MNTSPFLSVNHPCHETLQWTTQQLSRARLRYVQTFDLHGARMSLHDCSCPNHGTDDCDCQMVILLVYGNIEDGAAPLNTGPVTLILHGNNGQTWLSLADSPGQKSDEQLSADIRQVMSKLPDSILQ